MPLRSLLVANRGEIALRVMRTAQRMGLRTIAVYSDADRDAPHVRAADAAFHLGGALPRDSYLNIESILKAEGEAIHPGYGFLAESAEFAAAVQRAGRVWVGPSPEAIRAMGDKANAKRIAAQAGVPVLPTYEANPEFPVLVKAVAGGGGRGIRLVRSKENLEQELKTAQSEALHAFGDGRVILEKALPGARHVEIQIFADARGNCVHLGERDCSVQRRHQKLIEESPAPGVDAELRAALGAAAVAVARTVGYVGAGTVEFLLGEDGRFWFMEMNTRLQVEHPVTEAVTGLDLVEWQLRVAAGEPLPAGQDAVRFSGHAIEARLCAEDPARGFLPQAGVIAVWEPAPGVRVDHALEPGAPVAPYYDSMLAKLIAHAPTRDGARDKLAQALCSTVVLGLPTNKAFLAAVLRDPVFLSAKHNVEFLSEFDFKGEEPQDCDYALAASLLAGDYGEWTGWSNNSDHISYVKFEDRVLAVPPRGRETNLPHVVDGDWVHFARGGASFSFRNALHDPPRKKGAEAKDGRLTAPMNGRVVAVNAKAGERIEAGRPIVVLEAMKMEHGIGLDFSSRIRSLHVAEGAQVSPGQLLVEFEPA